MHVGQKVTLLKIDDMMAMTHRYEFTLKEVYAIPGRHGYEGRLSREAVAVQRGKRKQLYLDLASDDIMLDGWDLPFKTDLEAMTSGSGTVCSGNACFNLIGEPETIKTLIEHAALRTVSQEAKAKVIVYRDPRNQCGDAGAILLYPDIQTGHAVINRMKEG